MDVSAATAAWTGILSQLRREVAGLEADERAWMQRRLTLIGRLQQQLHAAFLGLGGAAACAVCRGECCDRGRHHVTLANALAYLLAAEEPPQPDFERPCPYLGAQGCTFDVPRRPFNCVTFLCDALDGRFTPARRRAFHAAEQKLRRLYGEFDHRYAGGGLQGLLLRADTLAGRPLLGRRSPHQPSALRGDLVR